MNYIYMTVININAANLTHVLTRAQNFGTVIKTKILFDFCPFCTFLGDFQVIEA
jgi:hypothetical protein